jgi:predicted metal-dependent peptidase
MKKIKVRKPDASEEARKQICMDQLALDRQQLLMRWPFIGGVIMRMELTPVRDDRLSTACTDGDNIFVDINFYSKLSREERQFVLAHEVWHSVLLHFARLQNRNRELFNIAADLEIHFTLADERMKEPFVLPHDPSWENLSAEEIYEKLPEFQKKLSQEQKPQGSGRSKSKTNGDPASKGFGDGQKSFDKHVYKDDDLPDPESLASGSEKGDDGRGGAGKSDGPGDQKDNDAKSRKSSSSGKNSTDDGSSSASATEAEGLTDEIVIDEDYNPHVSSESVEHSRSRTIAAAQQVERTQGRLPAGIKALLDKLQTPSLPWQEMLKQFVTTCYGGKRRWLPPARRHVWQDLYLPSMRDEALKAVVALDTSGSTAGDLPTFFGELLSLMKSFGRFELDVIQCDAKIQAVEHYSDDNVPRDDKKWDVKGLGGTDFRPVFEYIRKNMREQPDLLIFFTDGYGNVPKHCPAYPVMWLLTSDGKRPAKWGRVARFKKEKK